MKSKIPFLIYLAADIKFLKKKENEAKDMRMDVHLLLLLLSLQKILYKITVTTHTEVPLDIRREARAVNDAIHDANITTDIYTLTLAQEKLKDINQLFENKKKLEELKK